MGQRGESCFSGFLPWGLDASDGRRGKRRRQPRALRGGRPAQPRPSRACPGLQRSPACPRFRAAAPRPRERPLHGWGVILLLVGVSLANRSFMRADDVLVGSRAQRPDVCVVQRVRVDEFGQARIPLPTIASCSPLADAHQCSSGGRRAATPSGASGASGGRGGNDAAPNQRAGRRVRSAGRRRFPQGQPYCDPQG